MNSDHKRNIAIVVLALALIGVVYITDTYRKQDNQTPLTAQNSQAVIYEGVEGQSALDLLKASHSVRTDEFPGIGEFVTAIDSVEAGDTHFWAFYVNGQISQVGASDYIARDGDEIEWKLEEIVY